ncbi:amino acid racemase [Candidatus Sumerlaeota bacterium]|nr:amino acid racemase [Candidatus Sumerlaeota bacterium]
MKTIGILGGMGPLATADLYRRIILFTKADKDQDHLHVIIDGNAAIPDRTAFIIGKGDNPLPEMIQSARALERAGADFIIMPCNTAHFFFDDLSRISSIPFLNMLQLTVDHIRNTCGSDSTAGLLATDGTIQSGIYDQYFAQRGIHLVKPVATQKYVMELIYEGVKKGNYSFGTDGFFKAVEELAEKGASRFILGCTELSSAKDIYHFQGDFVDPLDILAKNAIEYAGGSVINDAAKEN